MAQADFSPVAETVRVFVFSVTRPTEGSPTQYTIGDVIADSLTAATILKITDAFRFDGAGNLITSLRVSTDNKLWAGTQIRFYFYNASVTAQNDNAAFAQLYANVAKGAGYIDITFDSAATGASTDMVAGQNTTDRLGIQAPTDGNDIYIIPVILTASTPTSAQKFYGKLTVIQGG